MPTLFFLYQKFVGVVSALSISKKKVTFAGVLIALGIIYGDIGTSPLYVINAIIHNKVVDEVLVLGGLSCIIWTLTLQTTIKYVTLILQADNNGEGGIFALYALIRRKRSKWLIIVAMIGGASLLADGIITPAISVTSSVEGISHLSYFEHISRADILWIIVGILVFLFLFQQLGTQLIGKFLGPIMAIWFSSIALFGILQIAGNLDILRAFSPYYAVQLLTIYPQGFLLLGAVFLCTTGAEALYSDLGHCGKQNIRTSWIAVKACLIINYLGQGAFLLANYQGEVFPSLSQNPFYEIVPGWLLGYAIVLATCAAVIASQALISGSYTLIGEAMRLNLWPKVGIRYPSEARGQLFIPSINYILFFGCIGVVLFFQQSSRMEAAYGLAITISMVSTSVLFTNFLITKRTAKKWIWCFLLSYLLIEASFLLANFQKFSHGGYISAIIGLAILSVMFIYYRGKKISSSYVKYVRIKNYTLFIEHLARNTVIPRHTTHLAYLTASTNTQEVEYKTIYSILGQKPKRADIYWLVHVETMDTPYGAKYMVTQIVANEVIRIDFQVGFRMRPHVNLMFRRVVAELIKNNEIYVCAPLGYNIDDDTFIGDYQFIVTTKNLSSDMDLPLLKKVLMACYYGLKSICWDEEKGFGLDPACTIVEKYSVLVDRIADTKLERFFKKDTAYK